MKIGDKVKFKENAFDGFMARFNGKEAEVIDFDMDGYSFILKCDDEKLMVTSTDLITHTDKEYQPKHAKEMVNHPEHYNQGKYECINEMIALFGVEAVIGFCTCNIYKYKTRAPYKNGDEDLKKAEWYMDKLVELQAISTMERE